MERRIAEFQWHCGPHPCTHTTDPPAPKAWRYGVVAPELDLAYSLTVSASGGSLGLHRTFALPEDVPVAGVPAPVSLDRLGATRCACDLVAGGQCLFVPSSAPRIGLGGPPVDIGLTFWTTHAEPGVVDQPEKFWRELEKLARTTFDDARKGRYGKTCPRCNGEGWIPFKAGKALKTKRLGPG